MPGTVTSPTEVCQQRHLTESDVRWKLRFLESELEWEERVRESDRRREESQRRWEEGQRRFYRSLWIQLVIMATSVGAMALTMILY